MPPTNKVRTVSTLQVLKIKEFLKQYWSHLGGSHRRFGSIDSTSGFTLKLIDAIVLESECLTTAHLFHLPHMGEKKSVYFFLGKILLNIYLVYILFRFYNFSVATL